MWRTVIAKEQMKNEYNDTKLPNFFDQIKDRYSPNTIWVIIPFITAAFIHRYRVNLKGLPRLKKFLKHQASKYVAKNLDTFRSEEVEKILNYLPERKTPKNTLYGVAIALLYFGLLWASEVCDVHFKDVRLSKENDGKKIKVTFTYYSERRKKWAES